MSTSAECYKTGPSLLWSKYIFTIFILLLFLRVGVVCNLNCKASLYQHLSDSFACSQWLFSKTWLACINPSNSEPCQVVNATTASRYTPAMSTPFVTNNSRILRIEKHIPCMVVSRLYHRIAQRRLFGSVDLIFAERRRPGEGIGLTTRTCEILNEIISNARFASVIRDMRVFTFLPSLHIFEEHTLKRAIGMVPHLRSFGWFCLSSTIPVGYRDIHEQVISCASALPDNLMMLSIPGPCADLATNSNFHCLQHLALASEAYYNHDDANPDAFMTSQTAASFPSLRGLAIWGERVTQLPMRTFSQLTNLILPYLDKACSEQIPLILRHSTNLEALAIYGEFDEAFYVDLGEDSSLMPRLKRLRIIIPDVRIQASSPSFSALNQFLHARRTSLNSLDIELNPRSWSDFSALLPSLKQFHVLGIGPSATLFTPDQMDSLICHLSRDMRALRLNINDAQTDPGILHGLLAYIDTCPNLEFIHINTPWTQACTVEDLEHLNRLQMAILNGHVWELRRSSDGTVSPYLWPPWKFQFRSTSDFPSAESAWLTTSWEQLSPDYHGMGSPYLP